MNPPFRLYRLLRRGRAGVSPPPLPRLKGPAAVSGSMRGPLSRTFATHRTAREELTQRFASLRRALAEGEGAAFDRLLARGAARAANASLEGSLDLAQVFFLCALLEQEVSIGRLERALDELAWAILGRPAGARGTLDTFPEGPGARP